MLELRATNPWIKQLRADNGWRVEFDVDEQEYNKIKELPLLQNKLLKITIEEHE